MSVAKRKLESQANLSKEILELVGKRAAKHQRRIFGSDDEEDSDLDVGVDTTPQLSNRMNDTSRTASTKDNTAFFSTKAFTLSDEEDDGEGEERLRDAEEEEEEDIDDGYASDLMGDDEDRARLASMSEVDRENILYERSQARQIKMDRIALKKKYRESAPTNRSSGKSNLVAPSKTLEKSRKLEQDIGLHTLRKLREDTPKSFVYEPAAAHEIEEGEDYVARKERQSSQRDIMTIESCVKVQLRRRDLENWVFNSFLNELRGFPIRVNVGIKNNLPFYKVYLVSKFIHYGKPYELGTNRYKTDYRVLTMDKERNEKSIQFNAISDSDITEWELSSFMASLKNKNGRLPTEKDAMECLMKRADIMSRPVDDKEVSFIINEKKKYNVVRRNPTHDRVVLERSLDQARINKDEKEIEKFEEQIKELDAAIVRNRDNEHLEKLAAINRKNREYNIQASNRAEMEARQAKAQRGNDELNPFARRKTRSTFAESIGGRGQMTSEPGQNKQEPSSSSLSADSAAVKAKDAVNVKGSSLTPGQVPKATKDLADIHKDIDLDIEIDIPELMPSTYFGKSGGPTTPSEEDIAKPPKVGFLAGLHQYKKERGLF